MTLAYCIFSHFDMFSLLTQVFFHKYILTNRLDLSNLRNLQGIILRAFLILTLHISFDPKLYYIGLATLSSSILIFITNLRYLTRLPPKLKMNLKLFDKLKLMKRVLSGIWNLVLRTGTILLEGLDLIIANIFLGPKAMGILALSKIIPNVFSSFTVTISGNFTTANKLFSKNKLMK